MLFGTRAERSTGSFDAAGSPPVVGPGRYEHTMSWGDEEERKVPFTSLTQRPGMHKWGGKTFSPGPGAYKIKGLADSARILRPHSSPANPLANPGHLSASAFRSRGPRISPQITSVGGSVFMASSSSGNPGPGTYDTAGTLGRDPGSQLPPETDDGSHTLQSKSYAKSMPSMPPQRDPKLQRFSGRGEDSIGPGEYDHEIPEAMKMSRSATDFHASPSERNFLQHSVSVDSFMVDPSFPGPGTYNLRGKLKKGMNSAFKSTVPQIKYDTNDVPGPGTYPVEDENREDSDEKALAFPGLRSASERSDSWQLQAQPFTHPDYVRHVPGPGHYPDKGGFVKQPTRRARSTSSPHQLKKFHAVHQPHQVASLQHNDGLLLTGFSSSNVRDCNRAPKMSDTADPGQYDIEEVESQSLVAGLKQSAKVGKKGIFGSAADRFYGFALGGVETGGPDPGHYQDQKDYKPSFSGSAKMNSSSTRLPKERLTPRACPGTYEAFDKVNYRSQFRKPKIKHLSFGSSSTRWNPKETFIGQSFTELPGPGEYDPSLAKGHVKGHFKSTVSRGMEAPAPGSGPQWKSLGPGQYQVHGSTLLRKTFNVTGPEAAKRAQGKSSPFEAPNVGGGAGGGIHGTRSRLSAHLSESPVNSVGEAPTNAIVAA